MLFAITLKKLNYISYLGKCTLKPAWHVTVTITKEHIVPSGDKHGEKLCPWCTCRNVYQDGFSAKYLSTFKNTNNNPLHEQKDSLLRIQWRERKITSIRRFEYEGS